MLRAARGAPRAIGLIDGVFERVLPVWHKEILWAMTQGIHVFGAASMGALRAAELHAFGMVGVGRIFADYRDGVLEADDEVAVLHGPGGGGLRRGDRGTGQRARHAGARAGGGRPGRGTRWQLVLDAARAIHYRERTWEVVLGRLGRARARGSDCGVGCPAGG